MRTQGFRGRRTPLAFFTFIVFSVLLPLAAFAAPVKDEGAEVVVWAYDSFVSEWGPGPAVAEAFKAETGLTVRFVARGDGGALLAKAMAEGRSSDADIILGIDGNLAAKAIGSDLFAAYRPALYDKLPPSFAMDREARLVPFDYGFFSIIYDSEKLGVPPASLEDLTRPEYARKLILMDPRTSTPGLGFLAWTIAAYGDGWKDYWKRLSPSILTVADGWDTGYGMFTSGEAPLVLSYTTSPAYHLEYEQTERYRAAVFPQGHVAQIEGAGILKSSPHPQNARRFMDFMLSPAFQKIIPLTNWMYPVMDGELPGSFRLAPKPTLIEGAVPPSDSQIDEWARILK
ncbi:MAG: thiamine ABC transporter substrate-binding protein [Treponema sp. GWB1_62_6]|nr:MAG: thiamine ABC transporter substrate-binding protein [Treponema sp. GWA1_62_8]OHE64606.1 MAG: thiamine ABC transporter substrate-binding protein [Treponema sp. GWB1_62_6]OHE69247.1 MAG: thiamine ABC transporter substrate-binding protein [Treponema sp. GWC1_61_84]OHE71056.1 MAG: thiamine ABC transporter substrate-binding protein [Treponema sp. RIFOXYC1_FULL_61_9]HCM27126.1 thiamine ABC transporter substrate-binding protein [Treponema sp.]